MSEPAKDESTLIKFIGQIIFYFGGEEEFFTENAESALDIIREQGWAVVPQTELDDLRAENARLREALEDSAIMIEACYDAPINPDSLPQMLLHHMRAALEVKP
jgi:hypothetical protein